MKKTDPSEKRRKKFIGSRDEEIKRNIADAIAYLEREGQVRALLSTRSELILGEEIERLVGQKEKITAVVERAMERFIEGKAEEVFERKMKRLKDNFLSDINF